MDSLDNDDDNAARSSNEETVKQEKTTPEVQADLEEPEDEEENPKIEMD